MISLKGFQIEAIKKLHKAMDEESRSVIFESGTGSGKTIILTHFIDEFMRENPNYVTVWFSPGKGNLEEQSKEKMDLYIPTATTKVLDEVLNLGFNECDTVFINWELVTKKGNKALSDGERKNLDDVIQQAHDNGLKFLIVIDEEHLNKTVKSYDIVEMFKPNKIIRASATPKKDANAIHITVPEEKVVQAGLIKSLIVINENIGQEVEFENQVDYLLRLALKKQKQLREAFIENKRNVNPLIIIQIPNKSEDLIASVESCLENSGLTYENKQLAVWLSERKENLVGIEDNMSQTQAIIIKQAVATGWDCPRAYILVKLRDNMSETFEIQTIGRIRRMPEAKHYKNSLMDSCYLYTFDEKFKEGVKQYLSDGAFEAMTLMLKKEYREIQLKKEKISALFYEVNPIHALKAFYELLKIEYNLLPLKYEENKTKLLSYEYDFDKDIKVRTYQGEISSMHKKNIVHLDHVVVKMMLDTHEHGRSFHHAIGSIGRSIGISYDSMSIIVRRLFCVEPHYKEKVLNLEPKELYAFVINNSERIGNDLKNALSHNKYLNAQLTFKHNDVEEDFVFPRELLFTYDSSIRDFENYCKNIYDGYISSAAPRSQGEKLFERFCEEHDKVDWFYKNGDKGNEFFSLVYTDNSSKQHHFYPDYIISMNSEIWIIEVKGGEAADGKSEDIDIFSEKKMDALVKYLDKNKLKGGFVRFNKADMRLYISTTRYVESMHDQCWTRLDKVFM